MEIPVTSKTAVFLVAACFAGVSGHYLLAEPEIKVSAQTMARAAESREALLERLTKILNYGSDLGLSKPGKVDAAIALGLLGDERAIPALAAHLTNAENRALRTQIVRALGWIGGPQAVPPLEQTLRDADPFLRKRAADALKAVTGRDYEYDKTGLPDVNKLRDLMRQSATEAP